MQNTRKFEMGMPLFPELNLGLIMEAQVKLASEDMQGLMATVETLAKTGSLRTIRKLAAIWLATDVEAKGAESNPEMMADLEERTAELPFVDALKAAISFQSALLESLAASLGSLVPAEPTKTAGKKGKT
jgi:hypothetical protein